MCKNKSIKKVYGVQKFTGRKSRHQIECLESHSSRYVQGERTDIVEYISLNSDINVAAIFEIAFF